MVLVSKAHLFKPTYPPSKEKMIGPEALFFHQGSYHSCLKKLVQASFLPSAIRPSVSQIEAIVLRLLPSWNNSQQINTLHQMKRVNKSKVLQIFSVYILCCYCVLLRLCLWGFFGQFAFDVAMISAFGEQQELEIDRIKHLYQCLEKGYNSMPIDLPGTPFRKAMKVTKQPNKNFLSSEEGRRRAIVLLSLVKILKFLPFNLICS